MKLIKKIGVWIRRIDAGRKERGEIMIMELGSEKEKWEVLEKKRN